MLPEMMSPADALISNISQNSGYIHTYHRSERLRLKLKIHRRAADTVQLAAVLENRKIEPVQTEAEHFRKFGFSVNLIKPKN